jgi:hypothetical protein
VAWYAVLAIASVGLLDLVSGGRMSANLRELAFAGLPSAYAPLSEAPLKLYRIACQRATVLLCLAPLALAGAVKQAAQGRLSISTLSLAAAVPLLLIILADRGADFNHLLDVIVLTAACAGEFVGLSRSTRYAAQTLAVATVLIGTGVMFSFRTNVYADARAAATGLVRPRGESRYDPHRMARYVRPDESLLSEDASVELLLGRRPIVLDAFMLRRIGDIHPAWRADLVRRLNERRFDKVVLIYKLDPVDSWWRNNHFGTQIAIAIHTNYGLTQEILAGVFKYRIYTPLARPVEKSRAATIPSAAALRISYLTQGCTQIADAFAERAGSPCCGDGATGSNDRTRISMRRAGCDGRTCGATPTS